MTLGESSPLFSYAVEAARFQVDSFIKHEGDSAATSENFAHFISSLKESCETMENHVAKTKIEPTDPENAEIEKVMQAIHELEGFGMQQKNGQEKANALNATFFWERLKAFKEDLNKLSQKNLKRGQRVEKVNKSRENSDKEKEQREQ